MRERPPYRSELVRPEKATVFLPSPPRPPTNSTPSAPSREARAKGARPARCRVMCCASKQTRTSGIRCTSYAAPVIQVNQRQQHMGAKPRKAAAPIRGASTAVPTPPRSRHAERRMHEQPGAGFHQARVEEETQPPLDQVWGCAQPEHSRAPKAENAGHAQTRARTALPLCGNTSKRDRRSGKVQGTTGRRAHEPWRDTIRSSTESSGLQATDGEVLGVSIAARMGIGGGIAAVALPRLPPRREAARCDAEHNTKCQRPEQRRHWQRLALNTMALLNGVWCGKTAWEPHIVPKTP